MMKNIVSELSATIIIDENAELSINEISRICNTHIEQILEMMAHGLIEPRDNKTSTLCFSGHALKRSLIAMRLQRDLKINLAGVALALDLLDEITALRDELNSTSSFYK